MLGVICWMILVVYLIGILGLGRTWAGVSAVLVVTDVLVKVFSWNMMWNLLNRSLLLLSPKSVRSLEWRIEEEMSYEGTPVKAPPTTRRRMTPPTPQQSSQSWNEDTQWQTEMEVQGSSWSARERTVVARMEKYLNDSDCMKLEIEELELLLGPEDSEFNLRYILTHACRRGCRIFEIFSTKETSEHLVASKVRCDERQRLTAAQCKKLKTRTTIAGQRRAKVLQREC